MSIVKPRRNGYIDIIKFLFAIIIAEFHLGSGVFLGGRLAVEGFFMISSFLMMKSVEKSDPLENTGISTAKFLFRKYKGLLPILFVSAIIGFVVYCIFNNYTFEVSLEKLPLLIFDIFPALTAGFKGFYVVGISWYLSAMFIVLAVFFPLAKKFKSGFSLIACPLIALFCYGLLSSKYGHLAVGTSFFPETIIHSGILRALAGCALGCVIYEIIKKMSGKSYTIFARIVFTVLEILSILFIFYMMHHFSKTNIDYVVVFVIFGMLIIGISGASYTSYLWNPKWTKLFGTVSTLIVLNHYCWTRLLKSKFKDLDKAETVLLYIGMVVASCIVVYFTSKLISFLAKKLFQKKLWLKESSDKEQA